MITTLDRLAWIAAALVLALAVVAQELRQTDKLTITRANVLTVSKTRLQVSTNTLLIGRGRTLHVATNTTKVVREFPLMTDILQRSQVERMRRENCEAKMLQINAK